MSEGDWGRSCIYRILVSGDVSECVWREQRSRAKWWRRKGSQSIQLKYRLHGGLEGGKAGWGSCRGKPWMHSWGVYTLISLEWEATKGLGGQGWCSANNNEATMVRWLGDCPVTNLFFTVFMGYTLVYCRSSPRALLFDTICVVTHSKFIAFNGGKDGFHFLLICFISDCFTVLHANQEDR